MLKRLHQLLSSRDGQAGVDPLLAEIGRREQLLACVRELLPELLRPHCTQASIHEGQLRLAMTSPVWTYQLRLITPSLLPRLSQLQNITIHDMRVYVIPEQIQSTETTHNHPPPQLSEQTRTHLREVAASCGDELLAQRLMRLARCDEEEATTDHTVTGSAYPMGSSRGSSNETFSQADALATSARNN